jgi:hypothetical protein
MKKAFLYAFVAVVLGVGIMLFPSWIYFRSRNEEGPVAFTTDGLPYVKVVPRSENSIPAFNDSKAQTQPADASLQILAIGFIVAMVAYLVVRRRVPRPTYRFWPY